jgi:RNA polymerase sigma factor (sigma-70 family)
VDPLDLYREHERMTEDVVHKFYMQFPLDMHDDVRSEARLALWRAARLYDGRGSFRGYAWMCVTRKIMSMAKVWKRYRAWGVDSLERVVADSNTNRPTVLGDTIGVDDHVPWQQEEAAAQIMSVVIKVGEPALVLRCTTRLTDTEIGKRLGLDQETITRRIRLARRKAIPMLKWRGLIA